MTPNQNPWNVGDRVTVGRGKTIWIVTGDFTTGAGALLITLTKDGSNGYVNTSWEPSRLNPAEAADR